MKKTACDEYMEGWTEEVRKAIEAGSSLENVKKSILLNNGSVCLTAVSTRDNKLRVLEIDSPKTETLLRAVLFEAYEQTQLLKDIKSLLEHSAKSNMPCQEGELQCPNSET
jgi:hypothetical protein